MHNGKDSTLTLIRLLNDPGYEVVGLYTTYVGDEVPFQATPVEVVKAQAALTGLPLVLIEMPEVFPANNIYQATIIAGIRESGLEIDAVAFGDMFCNGIEAYRRSYIEPAGWECVFPLMGSDSRQLAGEIIESGIKTVLATVDTDQLESRFLGRQYDHSLLVELPQGVDPCGEDGEFHTLVTEAPCFSGKLDIHLTGKDTSDRFHHLRYQLSGSNPGKDSH